MDKEKDPFGELIRGKLEDYTLPVDNDSWDVIEERLSPAPRRIWLRRWIAVASAAACIALLITLFTFNRNTYNHGTAKLLPDYEEAIIRDVPEDEIVEPVLQQGREAPTVSKAPRYRTQMAENSLTSEVISAENNQQGDAAVSATEEQRIPAAEEQRAQASDERRVRETPQNPRDNRLDLWDDQQMPKIKPAKRNSIRLSFGSGSSLTAQNSSDIIQSIAPGESFATDNNSFLRSATQEETTYNIKDLLAESKYPDRTHYLPLSFGLTLKKELNRTFAVESGVVYTFITNSFNRESYPKSDATLQLHYVGIPLSLHTNIYKDRMSKWEVYFSAGGMVEKGLLQRLVQNTYYSENNTDNLNKVVSKEKIGGLQWSISASPGFDYRIQKNYSFYVEPKISYYFDNDQPESVRTEHSLVVGLNAGIRYTF